MAQVLSWWGTLFLVGAAAWPLTKRLFAGWHDEGYLFSKAVGMAVVAWIVYALGALRVFPFSAASIIFSLTVLFLFGLLLNSNNQKSHHNIAPWRIIVIMVSEELVFFIALVFWSWIKGHEPSIRGLEKFMDYGFMQSILNSPFFPAKDMWYAGASINYYYFGHLVTAVLTKLSGLDLAYTFNLILATLFALTLTMSFSIGVQLSRMGLMGPMSPMRQVRNIAAGALTAFLVTLAGNMQTIYAFTRGYTGDPPAGGVKPFWELLWPIGELWKRLPEGMQTYWYANATRFIPFTIHEFPGYSFVVSDVHGHVLSIPFVLLAIALLASSRRGLAMTQLVFYGFLVGVLLMTNALDGPIYFALLGAVLVISNFQFPISKWKKMGAILALVAVVATLTSLPFLSHFKSFVSEIAVNCPPAFLANTRIGPLIFEGVEKCQISPLWMWWLLWGFFVYCGGILLYKFYNDYKHYNNYNRTEKVLIIFFLFALALVIFPEFFYFKDIYPAHFRSNTMFKFGYQAFILFSIVSGYSIVKFLRKKLFFLVLLPQLFLVSIFPIFAVRSYFGGLKTYQGIEGLAWMRREYPDDFLAITWLKNQIFNFQFSIFNSAPPALVEADGDSYTDYGRFSAFTGIPTIIGWPVHEWLWRGSYDEVAPRREDVRGIYTSESLEMTRSILADYNVRFVVVGTLERRSYPALREEKMRALGREVFRSGQTVVYETY